MIRTEYFLKSKNVSLKKNNLRYLGSSVTRIKTSTFVWYKEKISELFSQYVESSGLNVADVSVKYECEVYL